MAKRVRPSEFRDALQVTAQRVKEFDDVALNDFMRELLKARAQRCGIRPQEVIVNTEIKASDDGCDAWSPASPVQDHWFGDRATCWQFKAGTSGEPSKLKAEVRKKIPRETLGAGGRLVVVASAVADGKKGKDARLNVLRTEAIALGLPSDRIEVLDSKDMADWCNEHPALASRWAGRPSGLQSLTAWEKSDLHQSQWQSTPETEKKLASLRLQLEFSNREFVHLHIKGQPGVGKTRFALELCRDADWRSEVVYFAQSDDARIDELIADATDDAAVRLVIVADEAQSSDLMRLRESLSGGQGRIKLVTIGHGQSPDSARIPSLEIEPLPAHELARVVQGWHASMPPEHVEFVVRFADGYVRLAQLAARAVAEAPSIDTGKLLKHENIKSFFKRMLGGVDHTPLYVVAVLSKVGWTGDREEEGRAVATRLGQDWAVVRAQVEQFDSRFGIAPRGGRYRYISPKPLGVYLAAEAWSIYPSELKSLPATLPDAARDAFYTRLETVASTPAVSKLAREALAASFFRLDDFMTVDSARLWANLTAADPALAARKAFLALKAADATQRKTLAGRARREVVWMLVRLAQRSACFHDAVMSLALLGEAENEEWANNASREFTNRFLLHLGGTGLPYVQRLEVIDDLVSLGRTSLIRLAVDALTRVAERLGGRQHLPPVGHDLPEEEWQPRDGQDEMTCMTEALIRLATIARRASIDLRDSLLKAAGNMALLLRSERLRPHVVDFYEAIAQAFPGEKQQLSQIVSELLAKERKYWKKLSPEDLSLIEGVQGRFKDETLGGQVRQLVGAAPWLTEEPSNLAPIASELANDPGALAIDWPWLTSDKARDGWRLGQALAAADVDGHLDSVLGELPGRGNDLRVICGYLFARREQYGTAWVDAWLGRELAKSPDDMELLFQVTWRCGPTAATAGWLAEAVRSREIDARIVGQIAYGKWQELPFENLRDLLQALTEGGHSATAVTILAQLLDKAAPNEILKWEPIAVTLVLSSDLIRAHNMDAFYWKQIAELLAPGHAAEIAAAILREQADRSDRTYAWFLEHSEANEVFRKCIDVDPMGVWRALAPHLSGPYLEAYSFSIGFPNDVLERLPASEIQAWLSENMKERATIVAKLVPLNVSRDENLSARLLGELGDDDDVGDAFFSAYISGTWTGRLSARFQQLAAGLHEMSRETKLPKLRAWVGRTVVRLRHMEEEEFEREEEEDLRWR